MLEQQMRESKQFRIVNKSPNEIEFVVKFDASSTEYPAKLNLALIAENTWEVLT